MTVRLRWIHAARAGLACAGFAAAALAVADGPTPAAPAMSRPADAQAVNDPALKKTIETRLGSPVDAITRLPVNGLYEVRVGADVVYVDATGNYLLIGSLIDMRTRENLTRTRTDEIKQASLPPFKFTELPFAESVKVVKGNGKRKVAIFEDPNCGYCKKLEKAILDIGDVTIYVFLYPVLGPDSLLKSKQVWCAADRGRAWKDWMQNATALTGEGGCATPLDRNLALGQKLKVDGTPTMFFSNNKRVEGTVEAQELERLLAAGNG